MNTGIKPGKPKISRELITELRPRPYRGWVAGFFVSKVGGVGRGDFVTLIDYQARMQFKVKAISL